MNPSEVAKVFAFACFFDGRLQADEGKILAWHTALYNDMTFEFAKTFVSLHYMENDSVIQPAYFNREWTKQRKYERDRALTADYMKALESQRNKAATPEQVEKYMAEIREKLGKTNVAMETDTGEVAPEL